MPCRQFFLLVCYATCVQETTGGNGSAGAPLFSLLSAVRTVRCRHAGMVNGKGDLQGRYFRVPVIRRLPERRRLQRLSNRTKSFRPVEVERKSLFVGTDLVSVRKQTANTYKYEKESEQTDYSENHKQNPEQNLQENHIIPLLQKKYRWALSPAFWNVRLPRC